MVWRARDAESASLAGDPVPDDISAGQVWLARSRQRFADAKAIQWSIERTGVSDAVGTGQRGGARGLALCP